MYEFNKLFSDYVLAIGHVHEEELGEVYERWYNEYCDSLMDSPRGIISSMSDGELAQELSEECYVDAPSLTVMEALQNRENERVLVPLLYEGNSTLAYCAAELLRNINKIPAEAFAQLLTQTDDSELFELLVESLKENPDGARDVLLELFEDAHDHVKMAIAEILSCGGRDERVYNLLVGLFASGDNLALYASYLARYGDERCAPMLYRALSSAPYAEYIEIRNAIESLGGIVDEERDFSSDPDYIYIKENPNVQK
ncbi:MAG: hypothetical protein E7350_04525 [Clostridiales bacterium]|nr:hypothetical protein [Clostridiales bacterium]